MPNTCPTTPYSEKANPYTKVVSPFNEKANPYTGLISFCPVLLQESGLALLLEDGNMILL